MPDPSPTRPYGGVNAAGRQAERRARLLDAGLHLLGTGGLAAVTIRKVCERARLAARYFYENFADLDTLLVAVFDQIIEELIQAGFQALTAAPPDTRSQLHTALRCAIDLVGDDPRKGRVVLTFALAHPALARRRRNADATIAGLVAAQLGRHSDNPPDDRHLTVTARFLVGGFAELLAAWLDDPHPCPREQLLHDCVELFLATTGALTAMPLKPGYGFPH